MRQVPGQIGAEPDVRRPGQVVGSLDRQPGLAEDPAAGAVGAHHVLRPHGQRRLSVTLLDDAGDAVLILREAGELPPEPDVGAHVPGGRQQHRFQHGLRAVRHRLGTGRAVVGGPLGAGPPRFRSGDLQARQRGHPQVVGHQVLRRGDRVEPVADPQVPEDLDRALVDDVRARRVGGASVPLDDQMSRRRTATRRRTGPVRPARPRRSARAPRQSLNRESTWAASASGHHPVGWCRTPPCQLTKKESTDQYFIDIFFRKR